MAASKRRVRNPHGVTTRSRMRSPCLTTVLTEYMAGESTDQSRGSLTFRVVLTVCSPSGDTEQSAVVVVTDFPSGSSKVSSIFPAAFSLPELAKVTSAGISHDPSGERPGCAKTPSVAM